MAESQGLCFISYAYEGLDQHTFDYLVAALKDAVGTRVDILLDVDLPYGEDFSDFTELISSVDSVVLILTPPYRRKVLEREGGAYEEFRLIWNRYQDQSDEPMDPEAHRFELIPILFSGSHKDSIPDELHKLKYLDLTHFRARRKPSGEFTVSRQDKMIYLPKIRQIASQIIAAAAIASEKYRRLSDTFYDDLFVDLKASWNRSVDGHNIFQTQFVKTRSYHKIKSQQAYFAVGRKGSGKSTLIQTLPLLQHDQYSAVVDVIANYFNLEALYSTYSDPQFRSDTSSVVPRQKAFEFVWEASLMMASMDELMACESQIYFLCDNSLVDTIRAFLNQVQKEPEERWYISDYFNYCFRAMVVFVKQCIDGARDDPELFYSDIGVRFRLDKFLQYVFGEEVYASFYSLLRSLDRRILITLDGFDTAFDEFRVTSIRSHDDANIQRRTYFEIDWLRSLLNFTIRAKSSFNNYFYTSLDFCVVAPMDRFIEVVQIERDSYRNWNRWFTIQWSGIELAILLRKRLEGLIDFETDKSQRPQERLEQILAHDQFRHIPRNIEFEFNGVTYRMPLFLYVLGNTFWRPRGVLLYYARILALSENLRQWGETVTSEAIMRSIREARQLVIEGEFIDELRSTVFNIHEIIGGFLRQPLQLDYGSIRRIAVGSAYKFATGDLTERDAVAKIRFLYNVGFLGLRLTPEQKSRLGHWHRDVFCFNEGPSVFGDRFLDDEDLSNFTFVIHPIFSDYLRLDTSGCEPVLRFDWDYLHKAEAALAARL